MINLTKKAFYELCEKENFQEIVSIVQETQDDLWSEDVLKDIAKQAIDRDELLLAIHICNSIIEEGESSESYYKWDSTAGTLCSIKAINNKDELYEAYVDCCSDYKKEE